MANSEKEAKLRALQKLRIKRNQFKRKKTLKKSNFDFLDTNFDISKIINSHEYIYYSLDFDPMKHLNSLRKFQSTVKLGENSVNKNSKPMKDLRIIKCMIFLINIMSIINIAKNKEQMRK